MRSVLLALSLLLAACASPVEQSSDAGSGTTSDAGTTITATLAGKVIFDSYNGQRNVPAYGAGMSVVGGTATTVADGAGSYALTVPANKSFVLLASLPGEVSVQSQFIVPPAGATADLHVIDIDKYVGTIGHQSMSSALPTTGAVAVRFQGTTMGGYTAEISARHDGAWVYLENFFSVQLTTTTLAAGDTVYFFNVDPGTTTLTLTSPTGQPPCVDARAPGSTSYPVTAGTMTEIVLDCSGT